MDCHKKKWYLFVCERVDEFHFDYILCKMMTKQFNRQDISFNLLILNVLLLFYGIFYARKFLLILRFGRQCIRR